MPLRQYAHRVMARNNIDEVGGVYKRLNQKMDLLKPILVLSCLR